MDPIPKELEETAGAQPRRPAGTQGLVLTEDDFEIFRLVMEHRFLRREHFHALTGRHLKSLHRRLFKLESYGYLASIRLPRQKFIYGLSRAAVAVLVGQGIAREEMLGERQRLHELSPLFLEHEMMIVDIHVMLSIAARGNPVALVDWREGRDLYDSVTVADYSGQARLPVRPDAFFTLEDSRRAADANRAHYFLEADRSTANQTRFQEKFKAYWHYLEQGLHTRKYDIKNFRMLTITLTPERAQNLCALASSVLPDRAKKYFLFASRKSFSITDPAQILGDVFLKATDGGSGHYPLIPPPSPSQNPPAMV